MGEEITMPSMFQPTVNKTNTPSVVLVLLTPERGKCRQNDKRQHVVLLTLTKRQASTRSFVDRDKQAV